MWDSGCWLGRSHQGSSNLLRNGIEKVCVCVKNLMNLDQVILVFNKLLFLLCCSHCFKHQGHINEQAATVPTCIACALVGKTDNKQIYVYVHTEVNVLKKNKIYKGYRVVGGVAQKRSCIR